MPKKQTALHRDADLLINFESSPDTNVPYLTGLGLHTQGFILSKSSKVDFYTYSLEYEKAKSVYSRTNLLSKPLIEELKSKLKPGSLVGINKEKVPLSLYESLKPLKLKYVNVADEYRRKRIIKSQYEIDTIQKACKITDIIFKKTIDNFSTFKTETDVKAFMEYEMIKQGVEPSFPTIVASGKHSSMPHHTTSLSSLKKGFCVMDFGLRYNNYISDMTRTIYLGNPSSHEKTTYEHLQRVQQDCIDKAKPTMQFKELDAVARNQLGNEFIHSLGHGIGVDVHEWPYVSPRGVGEFANGMVFTIEPGVYYPNKFGIRIEDDVVLQKDKIKVLTKSPKDLIQV